MSVENALVYSIIKHMDAKLSESTEIVYVDIGGINLSGKTKPFHTLKQMPSSSDSIAAGHTDFEEMHRWQIGLMANHIAERTRLQGTTKDVLREKNIPLYDPNAVDPTIAVGSFSLSVTSITPIDREGAEDDTNEFRVYFDIELRTFRTNGDGINFTQ